MKNSTVWNNRKTMFRSFIVVLGAILFMACAVEPAPSPTATPLPPTATPEPTATPLPPTATPEPTVTPEPTATPAQSPDPTETPSSLPSTAISPESPSSEAVDEISRLFEGAAAAIQEVDSFHFELEAVIEADSESSGGLGGGGIPISLVGDFQAPDRLRGSMSVSLGFFQFQTETISIGDTTYVTDPQTGEWQIAPGGSTGIPNPAELTGFSGDALEGLTLVGEEMLDGTQVYHLRGMPPEDALGSPDDGTVVADFWIGIDDMLFRRIEASGNISLAGGENPFGGALGGSTGGTSGEGNAKIELTMVFSNYNEPVTIEAPDI